MTEHTAEIDAHRTTVAEAVSAWEANGPTSLTVALMADALYGVRDLLGGGAVDAVLAELPMSDDGTGHIADCGYDESEVCGCATLRTRLAATLARACGRAWEGHSRNKLTSAEREAHGRSADDFPPAQIVYSLTDVEQIVRRRVAAAVRVIAPTEGVTDE